MERIIAAQFETFEQATHAAETLRTRGVAEKDMQVFYLKPAGQHGHYPIGGDRAVDRSAKGGGRGAGMTGLIGAVIGAVVGVALVNMTPWPWYVVLPFVALGGYLGSMMGGTTWMGRRDRPQRELPNRVSGVMLALRLGDGIEQDRVRELQSLGGTSIEWSEGQWQDGQWKDFNPTRTPRLYDLGTAGQHVHEERTG